MENSKHDREKKHWFRELIRKFFHGRKAEPESPEDPYAYVPAPRKPRPSSNSAAAVADLPEE